RHRDQYGNESAERRDAERPGRVSVSPDLRAGAAPAAVLCPNGRHGAPVYRYHDRNRASRREVLALKMSGRFEFSAFGERFTRPTGALELMDDLGRAIGGEAEAAFLGGGNPAKIPDVQALLRQRLLEVADDRAALERMVSNYAHPAGDLPFRRALARLLEREYGWALTEERVALTAGSQASFFLLFNLFAGRASDGGLRKLL